MITLVHIVGLFSRMRKKKHLNQEVLLEGLEDQALQEHLAMPLKALKEVHQEALVELDHQEVQREVALQEVQREAVHQVVQREAVHQAALAKEALLKAGHQADLREADHQEVLRKEALQKALTEALLVDYQ